MPNMNHETIELICTAVSALALLIQALVLLGIYLGVSKAAKSLKEEIQDLRSTVMPIVDTSRELAETTKQLVVRLTPKVEQTVTDIAELARGLRERKFQSAGTALKVLRDLGLKEVMVEIEYYRPAKARFVQRPDMAERLRFAHEYARPESLE